MQRQTASNWLRNSRGGDVAADLHSRLEPHALPRHLLQAAVDDPLLQLEIGNAVAQQAADAVVLLEDHRLVAGAIDLLGGGQAGGAGADDRHPPARPRGGQDGLDPAFAKGPFGDLILDVLDVSPGDR